METRRKAAVNWEVPCFKLPMVDGAVLGARPGRDWVFGGGGAVSPVGGAGLPDRASAVVHSDGVATGSK